MKVLVIGSGGREHALCWKLSQSRKVEKLYCAPGNGGTAEVAENVDISAEDINALADFAQKNMIGLTVVGPEAPLVKGIVDLFQERGLRIFGPSAAAAMLEGSKAFAKQVMDSAGVPTARYEILTNIDETQMVVDQFEKAAVKADGLAQGKGVIICNSRPEIMGAVNRLMQEQIFGEAAKRIVVEELLEGEEASVLAFCDGRTAKLMVSAQDHKRIFDGDKGPNTGGMGAYAPAPIIAGMEKEIMEKVFIPMLKEISKRGSPYRGVLYAGLMIDPKSRNFSVLEFNARFGDPETQAILPLLENDLLEVMNACIDGTLDKIQLRWKQGAACCVVISAAGYPGNYEKGKLIEGLEKAKVLRAVIVFHAGTSKSGTKIMTSGGRVLGVTGIGTSIAGAIGNAYKGVGQIGFSGMHFRKDIGRKAVNK